MDYIFFQKLKIINRYKFKLITNMRMINNARIHDNFVNTQYMILLFMFSPSIYCTVLLLFVVVTSDLNLNRLRPDKPEGKLLLDLEVEQGFECLITKPTRIEKRGIIIRESLIHVLLTNRPDSFQLSGNYHPCLSDHDLVYGVLKQKINHNKPKVITFRSYKNFDPEHFKQLLSSAPMARWTIV